MIVAFHCEVRDRMGSIGFHDSTARLPTRRSDRSLWVRLEERFGKAFWSFALEFPPVGRWRQEVHLAPQSRLHGCRFREIEVAPQARLLRIWVAKVARIEIEPWLANVSRQATNRVLQGPPFGLAQPHESQAGINDRKSVEQRRSPLLLPPSGPARCKVGTRRSCQDSMHLVARHLHQPDIGPVNKRIDRDDLVPRVTIRLAP